MRDGAASTTQLQAQAAAWFAKLQAREVSAATLNDFREWRKLPGRRQAYADIEAIWRQSGGLRNDADIAAALEQARIAAPAPRGRPWLWAVAGGLASLMLAAGVYWGAQRNTLQTGIGEQRIVRLADGSRLRLDTRTKVRVAFAPDQRIVHLDRGQAFFDVAKDPDRPFEVRAGQTRVRALGTRFDVRRDGDQVRAVLVAGSIEVETRAGTESRRWRLRPGQQITPAAPQAQPKPANVPVATSWTSGRTIFERVPLAEAAHEMNRYSRIQVTIADDATARMVVSGAFDSGDMKAFIEAVTALYPVRAETVNEGEIRLAPDAVTPAA